MRVLVPFAALLSVVQALSVPGLLGRALLDTCASIDTELVVPDLLGILTAVGVIDTCLCLSQIPIFLETNVVAILAVTIAGEPVVNSILTQLVNSAASTESCTYPANSNPACVNGNPCGFTCTNGFVATPPANPTSCICPPSNHVCDGVCTSAGACPSSTPSKRRAANWLHRRMSCDFGFTACGIRGSAGYQCVDTRTDPESCGGCHIPLHRHSPRGRDCSSAPGVADVSCHNGACRVYECMPNYSISYDNRTCYDEGKFRIAQEDLRKYRTAAGFT